MTLSTTESSVSFLKGGGEMGRLTRSYNWNQTYLGTPDTWPQSLRTTLSIILNSKFPMFLFWGTELICFYNDAYRPSLGNEGKHPNALGKPGAEVWPETWSTIKPLIDQVLAGGEATWSEDQLIPVYRNGALENVYWTFSYSPISDESGKPAGVLVTCSETTDKVNTIRSLRNSEQRFQNLVHDASVGISVLGGEDIVVNVVNDAYARLIDRRSDELLGKPLFTIIPEAENVFRPLIDTVRQSGKPLFLYGQPYAVYDQERTEIHGFLDLIYQPYREQDGTITGVMVICQDVTRQKKAEESLRMSEAKFRSLIEEAPVATLLFVGREMVIELANDTMIGYLGKGPSVIGKPLSEALPELQGQPYLQLLDNVFTSGIAYEAKASPANLVLNGVLGTYYFDFSYKPLRDASGQVYAIMEMAVDVTEQVLSRQKLEEAEAALRGAIELADLGTWHIALTTGILDYSPRLRGWFGIGPDEIITIERAYQPVRPADRPRIKAAMDHAITPGTNGIYEIEYAVDHAETGRDRVLHIQGKAYLDENGKAYKVSGTAQDVTEQRQTQAELERQVAERTHQLQLSVQDLERSNQNLQQFAYVASHDLQEPLRKIQSFGDILSTRYADQLGDGTDYLGRMQAAASRMSTLIRDLLTFSRIATQQDSTAPVVLNEVLKTVLVDLELVIQETGATIDVAPLPVVVGDESQLAQLFQNLLSNALKFRQPDQPPVIHVRVQSVKAAELPDSVRPTRQVTTYHRIDVADNGIGFDDRYVDRIFQVFQRLHGRGEFAGTGIGLAICEKVAANHGGAITTTSQPGQGSTFMLYLPI